MPFFLYASFPNSRNKNRAPTNTAITYQITVGDNTGAVPTLIAAGNENRTYVAINNTDLSNDMVYGYATTLALDPSVVPTFGNINDLIVSTSTGKLYVKTDIGITTNWTITTLNLVGFKLDALQIAGDLQSLQDIYGQSLTASTVLVDVDEGQG